MCKKKWCVSQNNLKYPNLFNKFVKSQKKPCLLSDPFQKIPIRNLIAYLLDSRRASLSKVVKNCQKTPVKCQRDESDARLSKESPILKLTLCYYDNAHARACKEKAGPFVQTWKLKCQANNQKESV